MHAFRAFFTQQWYHFLDEYQRALVRTTVELVSREERLHSAFDDYAFLVFPMAKAYEGFLKKYFFSIGLLSRHVFEGKHFRIGRALNPDIQPQRRDELWLYGRVVQSCGRETADALWNVWLTCRNQVFHDFVLQRQVITFQAACQRLEHIAHAMEMAMQCQWKGHRLSTQEIQEQVNR
jgi:hypothetical protein